MNKEHWIGKIKIVKENRGIKRYIYSKCLECNNDFTYKYRSGRWKEFCSRKCQERFRQDKNKKCPICNKLFHTSKSMEKILFCSRICYEKSRMGIYSNCLNCGKEIYIRKGRIESHNYCSRKCVKEHLVIPKEDTKIEKKIQGFLDNLKIKYYPHKYIKIKHGYRGDIYIPSLNMVIECDGNYWHDPKIFPKQAERDKIRTEEMIFEGYKVFRLWGSEIEAMDNTKFKEALNEYI